MGIFHKKQEVTATSQSPAVEDHLQIIENADAVDDVSEARRARLRKAGAMGNGFVRPSDAQRIENSATLAVAERVTEEHEVSMQAGDAAMDAGRLAVEGMNPPQQADTQHQLHG